MTPNLYMAPVVKRQNESRSARSADFFVPVLLDARLIPFGAVHDCTKLLFRGSGGRFAVLAEPSAATSMLLAAAPLEIHRLPLPPADHSGGSIGHQLVVKLGQGAVTQNGHFLSF